MTVFVKDPNEVLDYQIDWTTWLGSDTVSSSTWVVTTGITKIATSYLSGVATVWLSGGEVGSRQKATNTVVTTGGRTGVKSIELTIEYK